MAIGYGTVQQTSYDDHMRRIQCEMIRQQQDYLRNPQQLGNHHPGKLSDWGVPNGYSAEPQQKKPNKVLLLLNR